MSDYLETCPLGCQHAVMHVHCLEKMLLDMSIHARVCYRCPLCRRSYEDIEDIKSMYKTVVPHPTDGYSPTIFGLGLTTDQVPTCDGRFLLGSCPEHPVAILPRIMGGNNENYQRGHPHTHDVTDLVLHYMGAWFETQCTHIRHVVQHQRAQRAKPTLRRSKRLANKRNQRQSKRLKIIKS